MNLTRCKSLSWIPLTLLGTFFTATTLVHADTNIIVAQPGNNDNSLAGQENSLTRQRAAEEKEQWNDTRALRQKINHHNEKMFDRKATRYDKDWNKQDVAKDNYDRCNESTNANVYWEPNTERCLDRRTGRLANP